MSLELIDHLARTAADLRGAMKTADLEAIQVATDRFHTALQQVQAVGAWRSDSQLKARIGELIEELEGTRRLACVLADVSGQAHMAMAGRNPDAPQPLYQRPR